MLGGATASVDVVVNNVVKGSENIQSYGGSLTSMAGKAAGAAAALAVVYKAGQHVNKMAQEGAAINQLEASFTRMNDAVYKTPNLLNQMRDAVRGTVADTKLMQGVLTLTAGASDELAQRMAQASPRLLEIAKAASTLNPALGDTAHMYDSLALGIKRSSPMILDNLGIIVKVGDANEKMAEQLGKTVEELTAEEKQMALLNEVMEKGGKLIEQAGGAAETQADSWARLQVEIGGVLDKYKQYMADTVAPIISGVGDAGEGPAEKLASELDRLADARRAYNAALEAGLATKTQVIGAQLQLLNTYGDTQEVYVELANRLKYMNEMGVEAAEVTSHFGDILDMGATKFYENVSAAESADTALFNFMGTAQAAGDAALGAAGDVDQLGAALTRLSGVPLATSAFNKSGYGFYYSPSREAAGRQVRDRWDARRRDGTPSMSADRFRWAEGLQEATRGLQVQNNVLNENEDAAGGYGGAIREVRDEAELLQESFAELAAASGDFFMQARSEKDFNAMEELLKAYDKAGRSALELARLGTAGGLFSSEEATTYMNRAALMQYSQMLAQQGVGPEQAVQMVKQMEESLANGTALAADFFSNIQDGAQPIDIEANTDPMAVAIQTVLDYYNGSHVTIYADIKKTSDEELESETDDEILEAIIRNGGG